MSRGAGALSSVSLNSASGCPADVRGRVFRESRPTCDVASVCRSWFLAELSARVVAFALVNRERSRSSGSAGALRDIAQIDDNSPSTVRSRVRGLLELASMVNDATLLLVSTTNTAPLRSRAAVSAPTPRAPAPSSALVTWATTVPAHTPDSPHETSPSTRQKESLHGRVFVRRTA